ncbi:1-deoxy-D-xylulose-5-phosphate reductoisomerase [Thalassotalea mangrovi]|uniref:1-deoxy-D-xylulose 5-phosphate reductoisomerase n=1 Tax=Thalassotalea mangrovi TaxID=2572245 RepID=A0A4U1B3A9_9GAMM|nr:1-deoxy-D-xylulose-5-phosphate reductoisomerase [Thalassotalea mangrovi]TKB44134.1 1-deoxy-D-xylulose-5-phosphate reductoisomerase [Thalassotalea mangrovi]
MSSNHSSAIVPQGVCILGSTGSIGQSTLDVIRRHPDKYRVLSLSANHRDDLMLSQCLEFNPKTVVMVCEQAAQRLRENLNTQHQQQIEVLSGKQALEQIAASVDAEIVMAAIVGASGLLPTLAAIKADKRVLLANKEALVCSGQIFIDALRASKALLLPIDSEHNAIFQCLPTGMQTHSTDANIAEHGVNKILLTGSGGPFRELPIEQLQQVTPEQACAHPNWDMGRKISVDSATMMNKGLEFIEAKWLFNLDVDDIQVVLHPQSSIHSMVQYKDGSVLAQLGNPDMRTPIAHALAYPERIDAGVADFDFFQCQSFDFAAPDANRYPNLQLAIKACKLGQGACTALNAANEVAVAAFLQEHIRFTDIAKVNGEVMQQFSDASINNLDDVSRVDNDARRSANALVTAMMEGS